MERLNEYLIEDFTFSDNGDVKIDGVALFKSDFFEELIAARKDIMEKGAGTAINSVSLPCPNHRPTAVCILFDKPYRCTKHPCHISGHGQA